MTQSQVLDRDRVVERPPEAPPEVKPTGIVPWIQWLGFAVILAVVGVVLWIVAGPEDTVTSDGSWETAEAIYMQTLDDTSWETAEALYMRSLDDTSFETAEELYMATLAPLVADGSWEYAEALFMKGLDDTSDEYAEMLRFRRIEQSVTP